VSLRPCHAIEVVPFVTGPRNRCVYNSPFSHGFPSASGHRIVICRTTCRPQLIGMRKVPSIDQPIVVLRCIDNGLGKEGILGNAQVMNVEKVRSFLGQEGPTLIGGHRHNMHQIYFTWRCSVQSRCRYFFYSNDCPYRDSPKASHTALPVL
jgi:hypothetical protein